MGGAERAGVGLRGAPSGVGGTEGGGEVVLDGFGL